MAAIIRRRAQVAAKEEAVEGTAETVAAADATMTVYDPTFKIERSKFRRDPARSSKSNLKDITGKVLARISFSVELKGSGAIATVPSYDVALRACEFAKSVPGKLPIGVITGGPFQPGETVTGGTSAATGRVVGQWATGSTHVYVVVLSGTFTVGGETITGGTSGATAATSAGIIAAQGFEYKIASTGGISSTIAVYMDGLRHQIYGARGTVKIEAKVGEVVFLRFEFLGVYQGTTDTALLSITYENVIPKAFLNVGFAIGSFSAVFSGLTLDVGNKVQDRENANRASGVESIIIGSREPVGNISMEFPTVAQHDLIGLMNADTTARMVFRLNGSAGNDVWVSSPVVQYDNVDDGDAGGIKQAGVALAFKSANINTADDEVVIGVL